MASCDSSLTEFFEKEGDLIQQIALLLWLKEGQQYEALYDCVTGVKTWFEMVKLFEKGESFEAVKVALTAWLHTSFGAQGIIHESVTSTGFVDELRKWASKDDEVEVLRNQTLLSIAQFVQANPAASEEATQAEVTRQITQFAMQVDAL